MTTDETAIDLWVMVATSCGDCGFEMDVTVLPHQPTKAEMQAADIHGTCGKVRVFTVKNGMGFGVELAGTE